MMTRSMRTLAREGLASAAIPSLYVAAYSILVGLWIALDGPAPAQMVVSWRALVEEHGIIIVMLAAFLEGLVLMTTYFPGSVVVFLAVAASQGRPVIAIQMITAVNVGFLAATYCNYFVGHFGVYRILRRAGLTKTLDGARIVFGKYGERILLVGFVHPAASSLFAVSAGIAGMRLSRFTVAAILGITFWNAVLGGIAYWAGKSVEAAVSKPWLMVSLLALWTISAFVFGVWRAWRRSA